MFGSYVILESFNCKIENNFKKFSGILLIPGKKRKSKKQNEL